ncbi:hypothetical protein HispidOSU_021842, partial [Sigmodon hispidus]
DPELLEEGSLSLGMQLRTERKEESKQPAGEARKIEGLRLVCCLLPPVCGITETWLWHQGGL